MVDVFQLILARISLWKIFQINSNYTKVSAVCPHFLSSLITNHLSCDGTKDRVYCSICGHKTGRSSWADYYCFNYTEKNHSAGTMDGYHEESKKGKILAGQGTTFMLEGLSQKMHTSVASSIYLTFWQIWYCTRKHIVLWYENLSLLKVI